MKKILEIMLALGLAACVATGTTGNEDINVQQRKWREANISHYRLEFRIVCYCPFRGRMPLQAEVLNGRIVSLQDVRGEPITRNDAHFDYFSRHATVDGLFSVLQDQLKRKADRIEVKYHPVYGFPARIHVDRIKEAVDDEFGLIVSGFEPLP